ncbi:hypothetical protein Cni_G26598 [Canna indica]|uniref:Uncharacterized protein n=1 Tax=Canna indica TaxID=4628 RepID=A0AAQ3QRH3_9LILI|nr:hypothetical protein Cni_G26598 [Canna indica]
MTLQLREIRAVNLEKEALNISVNATIAQVKSMKVNHETIVLSHEEYNELCRKNNQGTSIANSKIMLWDEKRHAAELRKANALQKLEELKRGKQEREIEGNATRMHNRRYFSGICK